MAAEKKREAGRPDAAEEKESRQRARKKPSIEENFKKLDEILLKMEDEDCPLEEAFKLYTEGIKLVKACSDSIDMVEKKLKIMDEEAESDREDE